MRTLLGEHEVGEGDGSPTDEGSEDAGGTGVTGARLPSWGPTVAVAVVAALGVVLRLYSRSNLWLDEALSVNIAGLAVGDLLDALRHDCHPPFYYLLLHYWMELFGEGDTTVRLLSSVFGVAALPLAWIAGGRLAGRTGARWALVVAALSPYAIRYSTEARMYSLVMLLVLGGYLLLDDALRRPTPLRLGGLAVISGLLLLSHYWSFWLLAAVAVLLMWRWRTIPDERRATGRVLGALAAGGVLFLPWLGGFLYQAQHTGTPWAGPVRPLAVVEITLQDLGGGEFHEGKLGGAVLLILSLLALFVVQTGRRQMVFDIRTAPTVRREAAVVALTAVLGCVAGYATSSTFQSRYAAVFIPLFLLVVAVGITRVPSWGRLVVGGAVVLLSLAGVGWVQYYQRTQSAEVAKAIGDRAQPGDIVVYCPDQLGPGFSRETPDDLVELVYPTLTQPDRVDWVDYAERNAQADARQVAADVRRRAGDNAVFVVWRSGYETFGRQCEELVNELDTGTGETIVWLDEGAYFEPANVQWYPPA
jgi:mannosyltransferase